MGTRCQPGITNVHSAFLVAAASAYKAHVLVDLNLFTRNEPGGQTPLREDQNSRVGGIGRCPHCGRGAGQSPQSACVPLGARVLRLLSLGHSWLLPSCCLLLLQRPRWAQASHRSTAVSCRLTPACWHSDSRQFPIPWGLQVFFSEPAAPNLPARVHHRFSVTSGLLWALCILATNPENPVFR